MGRYTILVALVALIGCISTQAPERAGSIRLRGTVVSGNGAPLRGVQIAIVSAGRSASSDATGQFALEDLPSKALAVSVSWRRTSEFWIDPLKVHRNNTMRLTLDSNGNILSVTVSRHSDGGDDGDDGDDHDEEEAIAPLLPPPSGPQPDARGKIEIQHDDDGEEDFKIEVHHLLPGVYCVAVDCSAIPKPVADAGRILGPNNAKGRGSYPSVSSPASEATLALPSLTAVPGAIVAFPVTLTTARLVALPQFTVEFKTAHLQFLSATTTAAGFIDPPTVNSALPFSPVVQDGHILVQLNPSVLGATLTGMLDIATLRFRVVGPVGGSSQLPFDLGFSGGRDHTFLALDDGTTVLRATDIATVPGMITIIAPTPGNFTCIGTITISSDDDGDDDDDVTVQDDDEGKFEPDQLPCGKQDVCELAGLPVEVRDSTGVPVLVGTVPTLPSGCH